MTRSFDGELLSSTKRQEKFVVIKALSSDVCKSKELRVRDFSPHKLMGHENKGHGWS